MGTFFDDISTQNCSALIRGDQPVLLIFVKVERYEVIDFKSKRIKQKKTKQNVAKQV